MMPANAMVMKMALSSNCPASCLASDLGGSPWFLLPLVATRLMRTAITLTNWWATRRRRIPHGEALVAGWLPVAGSIAFPLQMFSTRPLLSTFLVRDAASKLGQRIPVYGGADSRTEIAAIRATDFVVELMQTFSQLAQRVFPARPAVADRPETIKFQSRSRLGRWIDQLAARRIDQEEQKPAQEETRVVHREAA